MFDPLLILYGAIIGISLGLTGSGGSILAIPLLMYGAGLSMSSALIISLFIVASISLFGTVRHSLHGHVDWKSAIIFSISGVIVSPIIVSLTHNINETYRLVLFAILMLLLASKMWLSTNKYQNNDNLIKEKTIRYRGAVPIIFGGGLAGALSGFFGVGGGFIIVPLLTIIFGMPYKKAVATSLACILLISSSAIIGHLIHNVDIDFTILGMFILGGVLGIVVANQIVGNINEKIAKRIFAITTILLAIFMLFDKFYIHQGDVL
jgi:uncharacterized membrane protein YfcA